MLEDGVVAGMDASVGTGDIQGQDQRDSASCVQEDTVEVEVEEVAAEAEAAVDAVVVAAAAAIGFHSHNSHTVGLDQ